MNPPSFENAPLDILLLIFEIATKEDFVRLSMVNKRFRALLEPRIYHTIDWKWEEESIPPIALLLRTILARPQLSALIRNVKLTGETFHLPPFRMKLPPRIPVSTVELRKIVAVVESSKVPNSSLWINMLEGPGQKVPDIGPQGQPVRLATMDALLAVLLSQLSNLTSLHLGPNFAKETTLIGSMFKHALCVENKFSFAKFEMLEEVHFSPYIDIERRWGQKGNDKKPNNTICALTFFYAPTIKHITATIEEPKTFEWPSSHPPVSRTLKYFNVTLLREDSLGCVLSNCPHLETLTYNFYADKAGERWLSLSPELSSEKLATSLTYVQPTLKSLILTCFVTEHDYDGHEGELDGIDDRMSVFSTFPVLENLEVPFVYLLGYEPQDKIKVADVLPPSLKSLTLTDAFPSRWGGYWDGWHGPVLDVIELWMGNLRETTPQLEKLCIVDAAMDDYETPLAQRFEVLSVGSGLTIEVKGLLDQHDDSWPRVWDRFTE